MRARLRRHQGLIVFRRMLQTAKLGVCVVWPYKKAGNGYGQVWNQGKYAYVHRLAWEQTIGPVPFGRQVLHRCDNPPCFNPFCLFIGTIQDNHDDQRSKGRTAIGERNPAAKLITEQVLEIRSAVSHGDNREIIARHFGISRPTVDRIARRAIWKHI